jgi:hypothetical protein
MIGEDSGGMDLKMDLNLPTNTRRRAGGKDGDDMPDGFDDEVLGALKVLGGDRVLDLECLLNGFTNLVRCGGVDGRVADVEEGGEGARAST